MELADAMAGRWSILEDPSGERLAGIRLSIAICGCQEAEPEFLFLAGKECDLGYFSVHEVKKTLYNLYSPLLTTNFPLCKLSGLMVIFLEFFVIPFDLLKTADDNALNKPSI